MKFLFDENLSPQHAKWFRSLGYDAVALTEWGLSGASDLIVRSTAIDTDRVLIALDGDFGNILRYPVTGTPGVIWLRLHPPTEEAIPKALSRMLKSLSHQDLNGKLVVIDEDKMRIRGA